MVVEGLKNSGSKPEARMRFVALFAVALIGASWGLAANDELAARVRQMELRGETRAARQSLEQAALQAPADAGVWRLLAEFLDQRRDPGARRAYEKALALAPAGQKAAIARRLTALCLLEGDRKSAAQRLDDFRAAGGSGLEIGAPGQAANIPFSSIEIPGPMRSFARMAALSPDLAPLEVLPALARNVITNGYQATSGSESLEQTEYLKLVFRYLSQARELTRLAGENRALKIETCESAQTAELLKTLGFRMRGGCGAEVVLETVNASRAFLTMDSGFPLAELEEALRTNRPFIYEYKNTPVPVLYEGGYWAVPGAGKQDKEFIDAFLGDPSLCRLYLGMFKLDPETAAALKQALPLQRIRAFSHVFDFFGGLFKIRGGKATVPGGARSAATWGELVGVSPDQGAVFYEKLVTKDDGWMASYFDSLSRLNGPALDYLCESGRLKRFYLALRGRVTSPGPARPVFRSNTDLMLLTTRLRLDAQGRPHVPGNLDVWKNLFIHHPHGKYDGRLTRAAAGWKEPDDLIEALFGLSRKAVENEPLKIYLALSDLDRHRARPLEAATADRLARDYRLYGSQYPLLNETPALSDASILLFLDTAAAVGDLRDNALRANGAGLLQSLAGIWQVLVRQKLIPAAEADASFRMVVEPFFKARNQRDLFDAAKAVVLGLLKAAGSPADANPQDRLIDLLAGTAAPVDPDAHSLVVAEMLRAFEAQKLVPLKSLFDLADLLESVARGEKLNAALVNRLASRVSDLNLPRATLSAQERNSFSFGYWTEKHVDQQRKLNFRATIDKAAGVPEKLKDARGQLVPLLRDTLVGLLYIHYAPPGAQILYTNPLFVRSHDFIGIQSANQTWKSTEVLGTGWPSNAGGRLVGSLTNLPFALAEAEQNFLIPTREQALIWGDLVPQLLVSAKLPRWWGVTPLQMHWLSLHLRLGEGLVAEAALDAALRARLLDWLDRTAAPQRSRTVSDRLHAGDVPAAIEEIMPSELYGIARLALDAQVDSGGLGAKIRALASADPPRLNYASLSEAFGTPKPTLANSHHPELLNLRTFPTLMGFSSRIMAESWESTNLYFAALADELYYTPAQLNYLMPEWTQKTIEQIFATHLEDWPALLRSMRTIGDNVRLQTRKLLEREAQAGLN
jgi:hypothetical protein